MVDADLHHPLLSLSRRLSDGNFDLFIEQMPISDHRNAAPAWPLHLVEGTGAAAQLAASNTI
jgi:hypothetical protein